MNKLNLRIVKRRYRFSDFNFHRFFEALEELETEIDNPTNMFRKRLPKKKTVG